jgi:hypothetical protein
MSALAAKGYGEIEVVEAAGSDGRAGIGLSLSGL